jgi:uncharacterized protein (TIGR00369 family)
MVDDATENSPEGNEGTSRSLNVTWSDPMAALQLAFTMSRDELLAAFTSADFPKPPIAEVLGFDVLEAEPGRVVMGLRPMEYHCNAMGVVAAGVTATVLDAAMWIAVQTNVADNTIVSTVNFNMQLVRQLSMAVGEVRAEARSVHVGRTTSTAEARLVDTNGKLYAHATAGLIALTTPTAA